MIRTKQAHRKLNNGLLRLVLGQSMFELVFSIAIASIILTGIVSLAVFSVRNSASSRENALANRYVQEAIEWIRGARDDYVSWTDFVADKAGGQTWCFNLSPVMAWPTLTSCTPGSDEINGNTIYLREALLNTETTLVAGDTVAAIVSVTWKDAQGTHTVKHTTKFTDWQQ